MYPTYQITQANLAYDNFSVGIYYVNSAETAFPSKPMLINHDTNSITCTYIRDIDFSFTVENGKSFQLGLFLYNPKYIKMTDIRDYYRKDGILPNNSDYFHNIGVYTIDFDVNNINENEVKRNHFTVNKSSDNNSNFMKFDFHFMKLDENEHRHLIKNKNDVYYISTPFITFNPNDIL